MLNQILIVATVEGFLIKGLATKLKGIGIDSDYSSFKTKELEFKNGNVDFIVIFTDDKIDDHVDALIQIKERCIEKDVQIIVIGADEEYETVKRLIPEKHVFRFYKRPLDMNVLIGDLEIYMEESSDQERRKSILVVDDDVQYMSMIMDWLKDKYRVSLANSGMEAITWLVKNHADLILLDYEMPITTGPQVLEMIRSEESMADVPVMFLTGKGDKESIMKVLALKPVGYQLKTIDRKQLRENIANFFAGEK
ncbi:MAG: response regulator [Lachnospiraceae bacterium]|nr:response regulator [Lachnospiraceae bacterium]